MNKAKPTAGPWTLGDENNACCEVLLGTEHNLTCNFDRRDNNTCAEVISREEMLANAFLVIDAGTVFHTTGLTPSQLVERVKELEVALSGLLEEVDLAGLGTAKDFGWPRVTSAARAALSKARPNTAEGEVYGQALAGALTAAAVFDELLGRPVIVEGAPMLEHGQVLYVAPQLTPT